MTPCPQQDALVERLRDGALTGRDRDEAADRIESLTAELARLRDEVQGPCGYATWREAAAADRAELARQKEETAKWYAHWQAHDAERQANSRRADRLTAELETHKRALRKLGWQCEVMDVDGNPVDVIAPADKTS